MIIFLLLNEDSLYHLLDNVYSIPLDVDLGGNL